eukprot:m.32209 g.32209  ORF g.32209 m.32209 type:complete len:334 (+) comp8385_c0_seq1:244-1245(+)
MIASVHTSFYSAAWSMHCLCFVPETIIMSLPKIRDRMSPSSSGSTSPTHGSASPKKAVFQQRVDSLLLECRQRFNNSTPNNGNKVTSRSIGFPPSATDDPSRRGPRFVRKLPIVPSDTKSTGESKRKMSSSQRNEKHASEAHQEIAEMLVGGISSLSMEYTAGEAIEPGQKPNDLERGNSWGKASLTTLSMHLYQDGRESKSMALTDKNLNKTSSSTLPSTSQTYNDNDVSKARKKNKMGGSELEPIQTSENSKLVSDSEALWSSSKDHHTEVNCPYPRLETITDEVEDVSVLERIKELCTLEEISKSEEKASGWSFDYSDRIRDKWKSIPNG